MSRYFFVFIIFTFCVSCETDDCDLENSLLMQDGVVTIDLDNLDEGGLSEIRLISSDNLTQSIVIDTNKRIREFKNIIATPLDKSFVNTWISLDPRGNVYHSSSHYYNTYVSLEQDTVFVNCRLTAPVLSGKSYISLANFDKYFVPADTFQKTLYFDSNNEVAIPVLNPKEGDNNIRFEIFETQKQNDTLVTNSTYVDLNFFIEKGALVNGSN